jgi:hypothetical protein
MSGRVFRLQLQARYQEPANTIAELAAQSEQDGVWREFALGPAVPGFLIFVYAIANCQHQFLRLAADECGLALESAEGLVEVATDAAWRMQKLHVRFEARLRAGRATDADVDAIIDRMRNCPVSVNLADIPDAEISLRLV